MVQTVPHIQGYSGLDAMSASYHAVGAEAYEVPVLSSAPTPYETPVSTSNSKAGMAAYQLPSTATERGGSGRSSLNPEKTLTEGDLIAGSHEVNHNYASAEAYESSVDHNGLRHYPFETLKPDNQVRKKN